MLWPKSNIRFLSFTKEHRGLATSSCKEGGFSFQFWLTKVYGIQSELLVSEKGILVYIQAKAYWSGNGAK